MTDIMLDLETLSTRPNAVILVIGAIKFNRNEVCPSVKDMDTFYRRIKISSCLNAGLHIDNDTKEWWNKQDEKIKFEALIHPDRVLLKSALKDFDEWYGDSDLFIWGNGSSFDCTILGEAYKRCEMSKPWKFWLERDLRTLYDLGKIKSYQLPQNNMHHALYDCHRQIIGLQKSITNIFRK